MNNNLLLYLQAASDSQPLMLQHHKQEGLAVASIAWDDPFPRAHMHSDRNAR